MKKVRLALGAMGAAPALGLMLPATTVAAHTPKAPGKTVALDNNTMQRRACTGNQTAHVQSTFFEISVFHRPSTGCIGGVSGFLIFQQSHLDMRTRVYRVGTTKTRVFQGFVGGVINPPPGTKFRQEIHRVFGGPRQQVCGALVASSNHGDVLYGPVCTSFPS